MMWWRGGGSWRSDLSPYQLFGEKQLQSRGGGAHREGEAPIDQELLVCVSSGLSDLSLRPSPSLPQTSPSSGGEWDRMCIRWRGWVRSRLRPRVCMRAARWEAQTLVFWSCWWLVDPRGATNRSFTVSKNMLKLWIEKCILTWHHIYFYILNLLSPLLSRYYY